MYSEERSVTVLNATFVRPDTFYIGGFTNLPHAKYFFIFLCFIYIMTLLGNGFLLSVIYLVKTLHTPKYVIVFSLAFTDVCGSTVLIPQMLDTFLFDRRYIAYNACLTYMFFVLFFTSVQSWTLMTMAYDRLIAICFPLRYHNIVTIKSIVAMLLFSWTFWTSLIAVTVGCFNRLSFCGSLVIRSAFCDHGPVYVLACNDTFLNYILSYIGFLTVICIPPVLIFLTYICISVALSRITSKDQRLRALKTCTSHLILVAFFFLPQVGTNVAALTSYIHPNARIINAALTHTIPSLLNPIVYSIKTEEVWSAMKTLHKRNKLRAQT
ncbi:olfactory receptor 146-like [Nematolebias whitei]|uniref:olfactory receptor 146-like n=1 Tax=Nematolebias whitei TaxID=451745 RepID=UPI00189BDA32|nr:olfactory receptor 146-like [Nematolebias whitei]